MAKQQTSEGIKAVSHRAVGSSFEVVRPSGCVRLCLLVFFNVIKFCHSQYIVLVKLIQQS